jgi:hypothetical protein
MVWLGIKKLGKSLNFKQAGSEAAGLVENIFVKIAGRRNMKTLEIIFPEFSENDKGNLAALFKENKVKEYAWIDRGVRITFREYFIPYSVKKMGALIEAAAAYAKKTYPTLEQSCHTCHSATKADIYYVNDSCFYICEKCLGELEDRLHKEEANDLMVPTNYLAGFLGALLFSIPGIILTVVMFNFLNIVAAISSIAYIYLAKIGYKKFEGKINGFGSFIVSGVGILMPAAGFFAGYSLLIYRIVRSFEIVGEVFKVPEVQRELGMNILIALMVSSVFIVINLLRTYGEWSRRVLKKAKDL